jgi:hypothetical protein
VINEFDEWDDNIEFYNKSGSTIDMTDWTLTIYDYTNTIDVVYTFPSGFTLAAGAYVVLHEFGDPGDNTATDLYSGFNFWIVQEGGALALVVDGGGWGVDFVRWGNNVTSPPWPGGWAGTNLSMPINGYSLGRDASSTDTDYSDDWMVQNNTWGAVNDDSQCFYLPLIYSGSGTWPVASPTQSSGCSAGYYKPGEEITLTASPDPGWEVGQWDEYPATEYLGTGLTAEITMQYTTEYLWLSYIDSDPAPGTVLLMGLWYPYSATLSSLGIPFDMLNGHTFAPDFDVLTRYDMVIYQTFSDTWHFNHNMRATNFATYLEDGNCMWVEADEYWWDFYLPSDTPDVLASHFGVWGGDYWLDTATITGKGSLFSGFGPYTLPGNYYYQTIYPSPDAENAFKGDDGELLGVAKNTGEYISTYIQFDLYDLQASEREEIIGRITDLCLAPANDDFDYAYVIPSAPYSNTQDGLQIRQSTIAGDDPPLWFGVQREYSVWYSYTPAETADLTITTFGSSYDTVLGVWTGTRGSLSLVVENDDYNSLQSKVEFTANAGTTYYIEIGGYGWWSYGTLKLNVSEGTLFEADFETGDLSQWTRFNDGDGWLYACNDAAMNGSWGACVARGDNDKRKQLIDETPVFQTSFNARFNFDINSLGMSEGERFRFVQAKMGSERPYFIVLKYESGQYWIQLNTLLDDLTKVKTGWYAISDAPHTIEIGWQASSAPGANDGYAELYIDGFHQETIGNLDNDTIYIESFRMGFTSKLSGKTISGMFYVDDVATSNAGYIGLP